jgi:ABC-type phosphate transport system substrate-binding protein
MDMVQVLKIILIFMTSAIDFGNSEIKVRGKGASFPSEVYRTWIPFYKASRQSHISLVMDYDAVGSGNGQKAITANEDIEYAGSDSLLPNETKTQYPDLIEFPTVAG